MEKDYLILTNQKTKKKLVFYPVAKNANTSVKIFLVKHLGLEKKFYYLEDEIPRYKLTNEILQKYEDRYNIINFLPAYTKFKKVSVDEKACVVRDPLDRFISAYKNRILFHKDHSFSNHSIDEVIEKLENNLFENKHFLPQTYWLGNDLNYFTIKANIKKLDSFISSINNFFSKQIEFPKMQIGGNKFNRSLNIEQKLKIKKIYSSDYDLVSNYI